MSAAGDPRRTISRIEPNLDQLKALAHPVRLRMLGMLRVEGPATASGLALRLGLNSGATSYHLRQLSAAGLIVEDETRGTRRDRWWRAAHESTQTEPSHVTDVEERAVLGAYHEVVAQQAAQQIVQAASEAAELPDEWANVVGASDWNIAVTPQQARRISDAVHEVLNEEFVSSPRAADAGQGDTAPFVFQFHMFPRPGAMTHQDDTDRFDDEHDR